MTGAGPFIGRTLVVAPHADDEVIGCGGNIALSAARGEHVSLVIMAAGGVKHYHLSRSASLHERSDELKDSCRTLGISEFRILFPGYDMQLERMQMRDIVAELDAIVREGNFDEVYLPERGHNRDHQITHDAAVAALRPAGNSGPRLIAAYEATACSLDVASDTAGGLYVDISSTLENKCSALRMYKSQLRPYPHPTSEEAVRRLAAMRGLQSGLEAAERFRILRIIRR